MITFMPKGVYDRTASAWQPRVKKDYPPDLVEEVKRLYLDEGHSMKEVAEITGVSVRVLQRLMPRYGIVRRPAIKRDQSGAANSMWRGDSAGYQALHLRVEAARGKPQRCACCDRTDPGRYEWANLSGEYENINDYIRLCVSCHRQLDSRRRKVIGRRTSPPREVVSRC